MIGAFVRGLSMRDVESLGVEAGLGLVSRSTAARLCRVLQYESVATFPTSSPHGVRPARV